MSENRKSPLIVHQTVSLATANSLRERILRGEFTEGQPLLQDALAAEYGVSRIPLREALRQLESEGLVTSIPHRGCAVAVLSLDEISELYEIRALLECDILAYAIPHLTESHFERAQKVLDSWEDTTYSGPNGSDWGALNWEFHSILYEPSNRPRTLMLIKNLHHSPDRHARMKLTLAYGFDRAQNEHRELLKLCREKKVDEAVDVLRRHILEASRSLVRFMLEQRAKENAASA